MRLADELAAVVTRFRAQEFDGRPLRAFSDEQDVNPPCVFVAMPSIRFRFDKNRAELTWQAYLIGPNADARGAMSNLSGMVDVVAGLFPFTEGADWLLTLAGGTQTRAYQLTWIDHIAIGA